MMIKMMVVQGILNQLKLPNSLKNQLKHLSRRSLKKHEKKISSVMINKLRKLIKVTKTNRIFLNPKIQKF